MRRITTFILYFGVLISGFSQTKELDSLSIALAFEDNDSLKVETSLKLIESLFQYKEYNRALKYVIESEKLSHNLNYKKAIADVSYYKALIYAKKGDYINAVSGYNKSKQLFATLHDTLGIAKVNNSIGLIEIERGNYAKGLKYSLAAIQELERLSLKDELKTAYCNISKAYMSLKAYDEAIEYNLKSLKIQEQLNDVKGIAKTSSQLASLYSIKKENRKAIDYYKKVLDITEIDGDSLRGQIYPKIGREYLKFNAYDRASEYLLQGLNINRKLNNKTGLLLALNGLGDLNYHQNRLILAEKQLYEASLIAKTTDNKEELLYYYELMKALDSTKRRFDRAFIWQREYYKLKETIEDSLKPVTPKVTSMDLDVNSLLDNDNISTSQSDESIISSDTVSLSDTDDSYKKYKLIFYGLLAALAVVSTFLILIYVKRNNSIKYTQELEEKNLKIEMQNEAFLEQTQHLENVNNVKDKLFSIISHDLKDSLSSINGFIDLLRDGSLSRQEFENLIPELSENANNASLLLFNLLNWSKSQMQSLEPKPTLFDIQEVFADKVKLIEQRMETKGIELVDHSLRDFAYADRSMFEIVVQNLLANALKFCKNGDTITISNHISNGNCIVSVADTGIGISEENLGKIFKGNSFTTRGTNNEKGTGLGLSICKELVELNNGKIWVESTVNVGSTFYVQLPKSRPE